MQNILKISNFCAVCQKHLARFVGSIIPNASITWDHAILATGIALLPLFYLTVKNWTESWLVILALVSGYGIWRSKLTCKDLFPDHATFWVFFALILPLIGNTLVLVLRGDIREGMLKYNWDLINGPSRTALAGVAFLWMRRRGICLTHAFCIICPLSIIITVFFIREIGGSGGRYATGIIDFCNVSMQIILLGAFVLSMLVLSCRRSYAMIFIKIVAIASTTYIAIGTQGRGGWIAVPLVIALLFLLNRGSKWKVFKMLLIPVICLAMAAPLSQSFMKRASSIYSEVYDWYKTNQGSSAGVRLTMWQMSWHLIKESPIVGYGHRDVLWGPVYSMDPSIYNPLKDDYSNKEDPRRTLCEVGAHNQFFSDLLRGGIIVLSTSVCLLVIPLVVFLRGLKNRSENSYLPCCLGIILISCFIVFSITQSPFGLKVFWSFYGFLIAALAAQALSNQDEQNLNVSLPSSVNEMSGTAV